MGKIRDTREIRRVVYLCEGKVCGPAGGAENTAALREALGERGVPGVHTMRTGCQGFCKRAPVVSVQPDGVWYGEVTPTTARRIVEDHLVAGKIVEERVFTSEPGL
ncbi:MAG: (2Fe-2S) ferredoxin domain-containing protein [Fibrobacteria bacterium]|nr:(2Fe-2S) ferredoxin domain-containing protein [Fibrobacteria bacterium]